MTTEEFKNKVMPVSRKIYPMLKRILKDEEETRDALQDIMIKLWNKRFELKTWDNPEAYIVRTAKNYSFDLLKKKRPSAMSAEEEFRILNIQTNELAPDLKEKYEHVQKVINQLPEKYQTVIVYRDIDGFSFEEIKGMTGFEVPYIRVILSRARQKVKEEVEKIYDYEDKKQFAQQIL